jgi:hypothetical protein
MNINTIKALVPSPSVIRPIFQNAQVALFNDQDRYYMAMSHPDNRAKRYHQAHDPYGMLQDGHAKVGRIVDIYV